MISELVVAGNAITVTVRNVGGVVVTDAFWLDVYFNPDNAPQINQPWSSTGAVADAAWGVTAEIGEGQSLTLTVGDARPGAPAACRSTDHTRTIAGPTPTRREWKDEAERNWDH